MPVLQHRWIDFMNPRIRGGRAFAIFVFVSLCFMAPALAVSQTDMSSPQERAVPPVESLKLTPKLSGLNFDRSNGLDFLGLSSSLEGVKLDVPGEITGLRLFNFDSSSMNCLAVKEGCIRDEDISDLAYTPSFTSRLDGTLDIELKPRASFKFDDEQSSAVIGALVRIGDDLRKDSDLKSNTWYMFAGADAEAMTFAPQNALRIGTGDFHIQERIIVGDAQAGIGYRIGDADLSLGYFRREVTSFGRLIDAQDVSFTEDAAALSFTWRR